MSELESLRHQVDQMRLGPAQELLLEKNERIKALEKSLHELIMLSDQQQSPELKRAKALLGLNARD